MSERKEQIIAAIRTIEERLHAVDLEVPEFDTDEKTNSELHEHRRVLKKYIIERGHGQQGDASSVEAYNPEGFSKVLGGLSDPMASLEQIALDQNMPLSAVKAISIRLKDKYPVLMKMVNRLGNAEILRGIDEKIAMTLEFIDPWTLARASYRDLTQGLNKLISDRQALSGEPTQVISLEERRNLHELLPQLFKEAGRRGITIDQE